MPEDMEAAVTQIRVSELNKKNTSIGALNTKLCLNHIQLK